MKWLRTLFLLSVCGAALWLAAAPNVSPWDAWRLGYTQFEQGEQAREKGDYTAALAAFEKALEYYNAVREKRPDWNQRVITERIAECDRECKKMRAFLGESATKKEPSDEGKNQRSAARSGENAETEKLRKRLADVMAELEELRKSSASQRNYEEEITNLMRDQRVIREKYTLLQKRHQQLEQQSSAPDSKVAEIRNLLVEEKMKSELAARKLESAELRLRELGDGRKESERKLSLREEEMKRINVELVRLQTSLVRGEQAAEQLRGEQNSLRRRLENAAETEKNQRTALAAREQELQELQAKYREKLQSAGDGEKVNADLLLANAKLQTERDNLRKELETEIRKFRDMIRTREGERNAAEKLALSLKAAEARIGKLSGELEQRTQEWNRERAGAKLTEIDVKKLREQAAGIDRDLKSLTAENEKLKQRLEYRDSEDFKALTAAREERKKLSEERTKLEAELGTVRAERAGLTEKLSGAEKQLVELRSENRKLQSERINFQEKFHNISGAYEEIRNLPQRYEELKRNFAALQAENRENRRAAEAAKPQAAELSQVKLRLLELDRLKDRLTREQRFNEELNAAKRTVEEELKQLRPLGERNAELERQLADRNSLQTEVDRLRKIAAELADAKKLEPELAELKLKVAELTPSAAEAGKLRAQNAELRMAKSLWENEQSQLQLRLGEGERAQREATQLRGQLKGAEEKIARLEEQNRTAANRNKELGASVETANQLRSVHEALIRDHAALTGRFKKQVEIAAEQAAQLAALRKSEDALRKVRGENISIIAGQAEKIEELTQLQQAGASARNTLERTVAERETTLKQELARRNELEKIRRKLEADQLENGKKNDLLAEKIQQLEAARKTDEQAKNARIAALERLVHESSSASDRLTRELSAAKAEVAALGKRNADLSAAMKTGKEVEVKISQLETELEQQRAAARQQLTVRDSLQNQLSASRRESAEMQRKLDEAGRELAETKSKWTAEKNTAVLSSSAAAAREEALRSEQARNRQLQSLLAERKERLDVLERSRNEIAGRLELRNAEFEQLRKQNAEQNTYLSSARTETGELNRKLTQLRTEFGALRELNAKNVASEQELTRLRDELQLRTAAAERLRGETERLQKQLRDQTENEKQLEIARKQLAQYAPLTGETLRLRSELERLKSFNTRISEEKLESDTRLAQLENKLTETERLRAELVQLRKVNAELAGAKLLESELAQAKLRINRLEQLREEMGKLRKLNEEANTANLKLKEELARRPQLPAFASEEYQFSGLPLTRPAGKPEDYIAAGILAEKNDSSELAVWNYRTALKLKAHHPEAALRLGRLLNGRGDYAEAAPLLSAARDFRPDDLELALETAGAYLALGRFGNAAAIVESLQKRHPENARVQLAAALTAAGTGQSARGANLMRIAMRQAPKDPAPRLELARLLINTDATRRDEAARLYEEARLLGASIDLELEPKLGNLLDERRELAKFLSAAASEAALGRDWNGAVWYYRQLVELGREGAKFIPRLAFARYKKGTPGAAVETLTMNRATALGSLTAALIHLNGKDIPAAMQAVRQARALNGGKKVEIPADWKEFIIDFSAVIREKNTAAQALGDAGTVVAPGTE